MARTIRVVHYDAFSSIPNKGNPAGIVIDADHLTDAEMQSIAFQVGFNETVFVLRSRQADLRFRYFTPGHEMNLCGHATVAAFSALVSKGLIETDARGTEIALETSAGILPIKIALTDGVPIVTMAQAPPQFKPFGGSIDKLAEALGLDAREIDGDLPIVYGSTGTWTLLVPIKKLESFQRMTPQNDLFPSILREMPKASIHPFCLETHDPTAHMHARHFSSPYSGTTEDPVTGTASGVMGTYYVKHIQVHDEIQLTIEQGMEIGRDGRVSVDVRRENDRLSVAITGYAVYVGELDIEVDAVADTERR